MAKQILIGIKEKKLSEVAHYLMIYFPYNEEMCSYTDAWIGELYENIYPLVSKGMWSGIVDLKTHKLLNWKPEYGDLYLQAKICDSGTYFLLDKDKKAICKIADYVPNGLVPESEDCGDYIRLRINNDGTIENWPENPDYSDFIEGSESVEIPRLSSLTANLWQSCFGCLNSCSWKSEKRWWQMFRKDLKKTNE